MITRDEMLERMNEEQDILDELESELDGFEDDMCDEYTKLQSDIEEQTDKVKYYENIADELLHYTAYDQREFEDYCINLLDEQLAELDSDLVRNYTTPDYEQFASDVGGDYSVIDIDGEEYYLV